jgi:KaiC/GvpD/RAD55 family RecA-like ATPase
LITSASHGHKNLTNLVVFPLRPVEFGPDGPRCVCDEVKCARTGKHPAVFWRELKLGDEVPLPEPGAGFGIKTGAAPLGSDIVVVDLDGPLAEFAYAEWLGDEKHGDGYYVKTPRGRHLYYQHPGFPVRNSASELAPGVDIRGDGGFVVGPGSPHRSGKEYEAADGPLLPCPPKLVAWFRENAQLVEVQDYPGDVEGEELERRSQLYGEWLATAPICVEGQAGDTTLFDVVQRGAYDYRLPTETVLANIREHYDPRCQPPWGDELHERVVHKAHSAKTKSTRARFEPPDAVWEHLFRGVRGHENDAGTAFDPPTAQTPPPTSKRRLTPAERAGRIGGTDTIKLPTGIPSLDLATRGGLRTRKVVAIGGAPGAGKTALLVKFAYKYLLDGHFVGFLACDEDPDAILIRFGQLAGIERETLEDGRPDARAALAAWCGGLGERFIFADGDDDDGAIKNIASDLREAAGEAPGILLVDSIQTARCLVDALDMRSRVTNVVSQLKAAAKAYGHLVIASSELSKAAYRNKSQADNISGLSAFKDAGEIEYGVSLGLILVSQAGSPNLVDATVVKNRLGSGKPEFILKMDHIRADITETDAVVDFDYPVPDLEEKKQMTNEEIEDRIILLLGQYGTISSEDKIRSLVGAGKPRVHTALKELAAQGRVAKTREGFCLDDDEKRKARVVDAVRRFPYDDAAKVARRAFVKAECVQDLVDQKIILRRAVGGGVPGFLVT